MILPQALTTERVITIVTERRVFRDAFEIGLVGFAFLAYFLVRGSVVDRVAEAHQNAIDIINFEKALGIFWEVELQGLILGKDVLVQFFNAIYFWLDFPVIAVVGLWLYFWHRHNYTLTRDAVLSSGAISLIIYHLYPVAPPRLMPEGWGFLGTVEAYSNFSYQAASMQPFVNPYAAVPSLHYGWAVLVGAAIIWSTRNWLLRGIGFLLPWAQMAAIVLTANHFIVDAFAGLAVCVVGVGIAILLQRWGYANLRRLVARIRSEARAASA
ncbi:MAG: phosphatase PAP2 family protein [Dehalococcoidia bacterium]